MTTRITDTLVLLVERTGDELGVTLIVDGVVITGILTATLQYELWQARALALANALGSGMVDSNAEPPTDEEKERAARDWAERHPEWSGDADSFSPPVTCVRNAKIYAAGGVVHERPFLLISTDRVSAICFG